MNTNAKLALAVLVTVAVAMPVGTLLGHEKVVTETVSSPAVTVTPDPVTVTENATPPECDDAIQAARDVATIVSDAMDAISGYPPLISDAYSAGLMQDVPAGNAVVSKMDKINSKVEKASNRLGPKVEAFNTAADACQG